MSVVGRAQGHAAPALERPDRCSRLALQIARKLLEGHGFGRPETRENDNISPGFHPFLQRVSTFARSTLRRWGSAPSEAQVHGDVRSAARVEATLLKSAFLLVFTYIFLANAWLGDDAYITFRVVDNFLNGYGLTFNPDERVPALHASAVDAASERGVHLTSDRFHHSGDFVCTRALTLRDGVPPSAERLGKRVFWLLRSSKAFIDYTFRAWSIRSVTFCWRCSTPVFRCDTHRDHLIPARSVELGLLASLAFLTRSDSIVVDAGRSRTRYSAWPVYGRGWHGSSQSQWLRRRCGCSSHTFIRLSVPNTYYAKVATGIRETCNCDGSRICGEQASISIHLRSGHRSGCSGRRGNSARCVHRRCRVGGVVVDTRFRSAAIL